MLDQIKSHVKGLFEEGKIDAFLGLADKDGVITPRLFTNSDDLENLSLGAKANGGPPDRYPLSRILMTLLSQHPESKFGVLLRGCDERALNELLKWNQIKDEQGHIIRVGFACKQELADAHECRKPFPDEMIAGEKAQGVPYETVKQIAQMGLMERLGYWREVFDRCVKCYGCRDVCPVCFCNVCTLEQDSLIRSGDLPPENPIFHLTRAAHMAGRCIDCNLCTEACPAEIPLRTLYKKVAEIVQEEFDYTTGAAEQGKSPLNILGPEPGHTSADE
jgi:ferredoxin